ncbi:hypothetical protein QCA50_007768 [Cerrena zonata]|uniref:Uncharacterized protein n=1 Tax=Cerrena zonata TaxID=2478898 RepID=A0AAW0G9H7_9APHY
MPLLTNLIQSLKGHVQKVPEAIEEEVNKLEGRFGTVTLTEAPAHKPTTQSTPQFPGGFHPAYSASPPNQSHINTHAYNGPRPTPPPPAQAPSFPVPVQYPTKPGPLPRPPSMSSSHKRRDSGTQDVSNTLRYAMEGIMDTSYPSFVGHATVATPPDRLQAPHHPSRPYSDPCGT